ncbi:hypothetical protein PYCCODRAFT_488562 [Trametes coccinea BRFM310]|uniref:Uncharacterized protein n=1 Tax=Trametes coccinea (strain BRFM310) TaxID=1353009 RepID=A0A1Y2IKD5_TRAC3|nr:hypothetical protein PYCCODRAFT_488562 [Trametes coccinea BRFM310]
MLSSPSSLGITSSLGVVADDTPDVLPLRLLLSSAYKCGGRSSLGQHRTTLRSLRRPARRDDSMRRSLLQVQYLPSQELCPAALHGDVLAVPSIPSAV